MGEASVDRVLTWKTLVGVLIGRRSAIEAAASNRWTLLIGACGVLGGGLARSYDQSDLLHEPWVLFRGFAVTVVISGAIFCLIVLGSPRRLLDAGYRRLLGHAYLAFLGVYWLTAPMAWLYAVPYERMLPPAGAVSVNLWTLFAVSVWRVALMARIVSVVFAARSVAALFLVLLVSGAAASGGLALYEGPMIDLMGGLKLPPQDAVLAGTTFMVGLLLFFTSPVWALGGIAGVCLLRPDVGSAGRGGPTPVAPPAFAFMGIPFLVLGAALFVTQAEQRLRSRAESMLRSGDVAGAIEFMAERSREEFPPLWDPPPRWAWRDARPTEAELVAGLSGVKWDSWAAEDLGRKLERMCLPWWFGQRWTSARDQIVEVIDGKPYLNRSETICQHIDAMRLILAKAPWLSEEDRATIRLVLEACEARGGAEAGRDVKP